MFDTTFIGDSRLLWESGVVRCRAIADVSSPSAGGDPHSMNTEGWNTLRSMSTHLEAWFREHEDWLVNSVIAYAQRQGYTAYTSTLEEAWRISIRELSATLALAAAAGDRILEFEPAEPFSDPVSAFAVTEAARHRQRGIDLRMFLGLFKYYRKAYLDCVAESAHGPDGIADDRFFVHRVFDRLEIAFCSAWAELDSDHRTAELQAANRRLTNEKNLVLTVVESFASPVLLLDRAGRISYANPAAAEIVGLSVGPGVIYYSEAQLERSPPGWLSELVKAAEGTASAPAAGEPGVITLGDRFYDVRIRPMLDVSEKFLGQVVILHETTELRLAKSALAAKAEEFEHLSYTDSLTGLLNRRGLETFAAKLLALAGRTRNSLALLYGDVDNMKDINDRHGHSCGDAVLVALASAFRQSFREADVIARIGGDEFVVMLTASDPGADAELVKRLSEQLALEASTIDHRLEVRLSTGWASFDPDRINTFELLLEEADRDMYSKKRRRPAATTTRGDARES